MWQNTRSWGSFCLFQILETIFLILNSNQVHKVSSPSTKLVLFILLRPWPPKRPGMIPPPLPAPAKLEDQNYFFADKNVSNFPSLIYDYLYSSTSKEENGNSLNVASTPSFLQQAHSVKRQNELQ